MSGPSIKDALPTEKRRPSEWACKVCGGLESTGLLFRSHVMPDGRTAKRRTCYPCECAARRSRPSANTSGLHVVLGDLHAPFHHRRALAWAIDRIAASRPKFVVQVGDLNDRYSQSRFPTVRSFITPKDELEQAREATEQMWQAIRARSPRTKCFQLFGNHDDRPLKRVLAAAPDLFEFVAPTLRELHSFTGVETVMDSADELILDGIVYLHGWKSRLGEHASSNKQHTVHGHTHHGGTWFRHDARGSVWELDAGCLIDVESKAFDYRIQKKMYGVTVGVGEVDADGPRFIPFRG